MSSAKVQEILANSNWQYSQFDKLAVLHIGENDSYGMQGDNSTYNYTVPANHTLISYCKSFAGGGLWATGGTGGFQEMNGFWGDGTDESLYQHAVSPYYYLYQFDGHFSDGYYSWSYNNCWAITNQIMRGEWIGTLLYEVDSNSYTCLEAYAINASEDINEVYFTKNSASNKSGYLPQFHYDDVAEANLNDNNGLNAHLKNYVSTSVALNGNQCFIKEVFQAGEVISKGNSSSFGQITLDVLLLDANGVPVDFWETYNNQRNLV